MPPYCQCNKCRGSSCQHLHCAIGYFTTNSQASDGAACKMVETNAHHVVYHLQAAGTGLLQAPCCSVWCNCCSVCSPQESLHNLTTILPGSLVVYFCSLSTLDFFDVSSMRADNALGSNRALATCWAGAVADGEVAMRCA